MAIVAVFLPAALLLMDKGALPGEVGRALIGGGVAVAGAGVLDDRSHLSIRLRLLTQFAAAGWALWTLKASGSTLPDGLTGGWRWAGCLLVLLGLVWMINLYNFMDGIDGIAGTEAVCVSGLGGLLLVWTGQAGYAQGAWTLAAASAGFLVWNWPPARIFMGDVGSGFLGFVFGVLMLFSTRERPELAWCWLILFSAFIVDATVTLMRRMVSGARWYEAHCDRAYQHAARRYGSHLKVTLTLTAINAVWLFPLAWAASVRPALGPLFALTAITPLVCLALRFDAGRAQTSPGETRGVQDQGQRFCAVDPADLGFRIQLGDVEEYPEITSRTPRVSEPQHRLCDGDEELRIR